MQDFSFTEADLETLEVDDAGGVFYGDTLLPDPAQTEGAAIPDAITPDDVSQETLANAFLLHSRPGSANVVYIDFDGAVLTGTAWNSTYTQLNALPYNVEGDGATFSDLERMRIVDIWHRIAEDFAPYDIDVTTEEPEVFTSTTGTILVTNSIDANGHIINCSSCGGVAYVNVFGRSNYHTFYSPALVFFDKLGNGDETYVAEASSHEFGHNLGLSHDGNSETAYYAGQGSGLVSWAPIMGNSYNNNVTEWSKGEYPDANQTQDDLAIIEGKLGYTPDDHGDTFATATLLSSDANGAVIASNPELDPFDTLPENKGVIGSVDDVDVFRFTAGDGPVRLTITPSWDAFYRTSRRGANLDIEAELRNQAGATVAYDEPIDDTDAVINANVSAGTYYLLISGAGNAVTPYSDYDSLGHYYINGSIPAGNALDNTPPTPNPMAFSSMPAATSESAISMTATTAVDDVSGVEYKFLCVAGDQQCDNASSGWQTSSTYTATGLTASTVYNFQTMARDLSGNETARSAIASATTSEPPPPLPYKDFFAIGETTVAGALSGTYANTLDNDGSTQSITEIESGGNPTTRYSYLEQRWHFDEVAGATVTLYANAWSNGSTDGDAFSFEYSVDNGSSFSPLFTVTSTSAGNLQMADIPGSPSGAIIVRVVDTSRAEGHNELNTLNVDQLFIRSMSDVSNDAPDGQPSNLIAVAAGPSLVEMSWTNGSSNESGLKVERSPDGNSGWIVIADLPATSSSYRDTGLTAETTYYYRVSAYTESQLVSAYANTTVTTPAVPPPAPTSQVSLYADGYNVSGQYHVRLMWHGLESVDVYRNDIRIATVKSGDNFDDDVGASGGTYTHKVCNTASGVCSNVTTTVL